MEFRVTDHPTTTVVEGTRTRVEDDIFTYLVVEHKDGTVEVFRTVKGGCYQVHKVFFDYAHFEQRMPETARAIQRDRIQNVKKI